MKKDISTIAQTRFSDPDWDEKITHWREEIITKVARRAKNHVMEGVRPKNLKELVHYAYSFIQYEAQQVLSENHGRFTPMSGMVAAKKLQDKVEEAIREDKIKIRFDADRYEEMLPKLKAGKPNFIRFLRAKRYHVLGYLAATGEGAVNFSAFRHLGLNVMGATLASGLIIVAVAGGTWYLARYINEAASLKKRIQRYVISIAPYATMFSALAIFRGKALNHIPGYLKDSGIQEQHFGPAAAAIATLSIIGTFIMLFVMTKVVPAKREQEAYDEYIQKRDEIAEFKEQLDLRIQRVSDTEKQGAIETGLAFSCWEYAHTIEERIIAIATELADVYKETFRKCLINETLHDCFFEPYTFKFKRFFKPLNNEQQIRIYSCSTAVSFLQRKAARAALPYQ